MDDELETPYFTEFALFMGRGAGKNGFISAISDFFTTPIHGIKKYDISIVANSEDQAKTSFNEVYDTLLDNKRNKTGERPKAPYEVSKTEIKNRSTQSIIKYNTSNTKQKMVVVKVVSYLMKLQFMKLLTWLTSNVVA